jgi:DMSO reductase anchor subunit
MSHDDGHAPLVAFTSLAIAGAGIVAAAFSGLYARDGLVEAAWLGLALLAAGLAVSMLHLGRRDRAHLAASGLFRSAISNEGALGVLVCVAGLAAAAGLAGSASPMVQRAAALVAVAFLASIGLVYRLGGQLTWGGVSALTPVTAGLAFGAVVADSLPPPHVASTLTLAALGADAFTFAQRWRQVTTVAMTVPVGRGPWFERRYELLAARFLLLDAFPCVGLLVWPTPLVALIAAAGLAIDRFGFYALAAQHRTEVEVARVERYMDSPPPPGA